MINIITINYNNLDGLLATIKSIKGQSFQEWKLIIVDGLSSDGSELLHFTDSRIQFHSELDSGIYDAMNKGISLCSSAGHTIFLNSGDSFVSLDVLDKVVNRLKNNSTVYYGSIIANYGTYVVNNLPRPIEAFWKEKPFHHQSAFYPSSLLKEFGFDSAFKFCADYDQFRMLYSSGVVFEEMDLEIALVERVSGASTILSNYLSVWSENYSIATEFGLTFAQHTWHYFSFFRRLIVKLLPFSLVRIFRKAKNK